jgi:hypothetical protein
VFAGLVCCTGGLTRDLANSSQYLLPGHRLCRNSYFSGLLLLVLLVLRRHASKGKRWNLAAAHLSQYQLVLAQHYIVVRLYLDRLADIRVVCVQVLAVRFTILSLKSWVCEL